MSSPSPSADPADDRYRAVNLANWESRVPLHEQGYDLDRYRDDPDLVSDVVRFDLPRLGDLSGLDVVHLQCHIGTDTISLARRGARVTGLDFSPSALAVADRLARDCGIQATWVESDLYDAVDALGGARFDLVYTGIGALCWLPDVARWAEVVAGLLRPGGRLHIREGHPVVWALDDPREDGLIVLRYPYFEVPGGTTFVEEETYVPQDAPVASPESVCFNHGIGEILGAVTGAGLHLTCFEEHQSVPYNPLGDLMVEGDDGEYRLREEPERLPLTYTLQAVKPG